MRHVREPSLREKQTCTVARRRRSGCRAEGVDLHVSHESLCRVSALRLAAILAQLGGEVGAHVEGEAVALARDLQVAPALAQRELAGCVLEVVPLLRPAKKRISESTSTRDG